MSSPEIPRDQVDETIRANAQQPLKSGPNGRDNPHVSTLRSSSGHLTANKNAAFDKSPDLPRVAKPAEFVNGAKISDTSGNSVDRVYSKRDSYAIYRSGDEVLVVYSDDKATACKQIAAISGLLPLRDQLTNIIKELPQDNLKKPYRVKAAEALRLGLEDQVEIGKALLLGAFNDAKETLTRIARIRYLFYAGSGAIITAVAIASFLIIGGSAQIHDSVHLALLAIGGGLTGVLLSIATGIRCRTVVIDGNDQANLIDAVLRVLIGAISAGVLFLLLHSGALVDVQLGAAKFGGPNASPEITLLVGFAAGFFDRLVPDLLEKAVPAQAGTATASAPVLASP